MKKDKFTLPTTKDDKNKSILKTVLISTVGIVLVGTAGTFAYLAKKK